MNEPIIVWNAPEHHHVPKKADWYWAVGIITLALAAVMFMFGQIITGIFVIVAATALVIHASHAPRIINIQIHDRGIVVDNDLYPFLTLDSFWISHEDDTKIILKSRKTFMPFIIVHIEEVDPEDVRQVLLKYIAETEHHESIFKRLLEKAGF